MTAIETTYEDCVNLIRDTVWKFIQHYRQTINDYDEMFAYANERFMYAYNSFDPNKHTKFTTWLRLTVWKGLQMELGKKMRQAEIQERRPYLKSPQPHGPYYVDLLDGLGEDAVNILQLFWDAPEDLERIFRRSQKRPARHLVFQYLKDNEWSRKQILNSFHDLKKILV